MIFQLFIVAYILYSDVSYYKDLDLACVSNTALIIPTCQFTEYFYVIKNAFGIQIQAQSKFVAFTVHQQWLTTIQCFSEITPIVHFVMISDSKAGVIILTCT